MTLSAKELADVAGPRLVLDSLTATRRQRSLLAACLHAADLEL